MRVEMSAASDLLARLRAEPQRFAKYDVLDRLGRGGMGVVTAVLVPWQQDSFVPVNDPLPVDVTLSLYELAPRLRHYAR